jgi:tRNA threonylcarbamoyladenosine biosynthesis protein TsaE
LGAGKTTLVQGLGEGLGVRGQVASPTFIIARVHPPLAAGGTPLVHVDAYRLDNLGQLDDLDLDTDIEDSITVVEWGEGVAEHLGAPYLEIRLDRVRGAAAGEARIARLRGHGPRWAHLP